MDSGLKGRHVLITGASGGIGKAIAYQFDKEESVISLHYHQNKKSILELSSELKSTHSIFQADLSSESSIDKLFKDCISAHGRIDHLIVNHGIWPEDYVPIHRMKLEQFDTTITINLRAAFICAKYFLKNLKDFPQERASIVLIGSTAGIFGEAGHVDYSISKSGLFGLMLSLKNEIINLSPHGRVNLVAPGWTITPMTHKFMNDHDGIKKTLQTIPLRKLARPSDVAKSVLFLSSDKLSGHVSGQIITVAGGMEGRRLFNPNEIDINQI